MKILFRIFFFSLLLASCEGKRKTIFQTKIAFFTDTALSKKLIPISSVDSSNRLGFRFSITGDFDGDGKTDTLTEHFISAITNKETNQIQPSSQQ